LLAVIVLAVRLGCKPGQTHYYGLPHPRSDEDPEVIRTCYNCGRTKKVKVDVGRGATGGTPPLKAELSTGGIYRTHYDCPCKCGTRKFPMQKEQLLDVEQASDSQHAIM